MAKTTSEKAPSAKEFLKNRIIRIIPIYWILTLTAGVFIILKFHIFGKVGGVSEIIKSLLFIPYPGGPILFVGWTLIYEMAFYLLFALTLFIGDRNVRLTVAISGIVLLTIFGRSPHAGYVLNYLSNPIILEFALGILAHVVTRRVSFGRPAALLMAVVGFMTIASAGLLEPFVLSKAAIELSAFLVVLGAVYLEESGVTIGRGLLVLQGNASYSLYLTHPFVLQVIGKAALLSGLASSDYGIAATLCLIFVVAGMFGTWFHLNIEKPLTRYFKTLAAPRDRLEYIVQ